MLRRKHGVKINKGEPHLKWGSPGGSDGKESVCNQETQVQSLGWDDSLEK